MDIRLFVLRFLRKSPAILFAAVLGALCVGGPYFLVKVTFGPAREYEAVTDFYIDYAVQENGEEYTYFNQTTWTQLITDDVFTDKILTDMSGMRLASEGDDSQRMSLQDAEENDSQAADLWEKKEWSGTLPDVEKAAGITKQELRGYLYATMLSDTRIVTTTVTTNDPELTMRIEKALILAMKDFGREQKEIAGVRILQEPTEASLVITDVRTFRACMLGAVIFVFVTVFYLLLYFVLDEGIYIPATFERRYGVPMLGTISSPELSVLAEKLDSVGMYLLAADQGTDPEQVKKALAEKGVETAGVVRWEEIFGGAEEGESKEGRASHGKQTQADRGRTEGTQVETGEKQAGRKILLAVKAGAHNGKRIEKTLDLCRKCGLEVAAALLWKADEKLIGAYELPEHVLHAWGRMKKK